jgi:uncharacterized membrane protein
MTAIAQSAAPAAPRTPAAPRQSRVASVDVVRGAVMILMALDHVRDYVTNLRFQPENLERGTAALFATRWVTHFCAPAFFLLAGIGIGVAMNRGKRPGEMSRYLVTRGLWLLVLELVITPLGWRFDVNLLPAFALVLWALGWSMILMALMVHLPRVVVGALAVLVIVGHNALDGVRPAAFGSFAWLWHVLHVPGFAVPGVFLVAYPLIPWVGVMGLGYVLASAYAWDSERRKKLFVAIGVAATLMFVALRATHSYGNPGVWTPQRSPDLTVAAFFNLQKYPPSLQFLGMTLGPVLIALALVEKAHGRVASIITVYGKVPFFYYFGHFYLAHIIAIGVAAVQVGGLHRINILTEAEKIPVGFGFALPGVYITWMIVVALMYFPSRWFADLKARRPDLVWLSYF